MLQVVVFVVPHSSALRYFSYSPLSFYGACLRAKGKGHFQKHQCKPDFHKPYATMQALVGIGGSEMHVCVCVCVGGGTIN